METAAIVYNYKNRFGLYKNIYYFVQDWWLYGIDNMVDVVYTSRKHTYIIYMWRESRNTNEHLL